MVKRQAKPYTHSGINRAHANRQQEQTNQQLELLGVMEGYRGKKCRGKELRVTKG